MGGGGGENPTVEAEESVTQSERGTHWELSVPGRAEVGATELPMKQSLLSVYTKTTASTRQRTATAVAAMPNG